MSVDRELSPRSERCADAPRAPSTRTVGAGTVEEAAPRRLLE
jgi:hypothetical protein